MKKQTKQTPAIQTRKMMMSKPTTNEVMNN